MSNYYSNNSKGRICLYFRTKSPQKKWINGDQFIISFIKRLLKGKKIGGIEKVFINLCKGLDSLKIKYKVNLPFDKLLPSDVVIVLGNGRYALEGYNKSNKIIAGIALMTHPSEWKELPFQYPIAKYLQHSQWAKNMYTKYYGSKVCDTWFAGIDAHKWEPDHNVEKSIDILIYNKIKWNIDDYEKSLTEPIKRYLFNNGLKVAEIKYGFYKEAEYLALLKKCKAMIFLSEHESQGFACCEALSMNVPILAWDQGYCLDPNRYVWGDLVIPTTSVPFFDDRCGERFNTLSDFESIFPVFQKRVLIGEYQPRNYILENLTLEKSAKRMLEIIEEVYK